MVDERRAPLSSEHFDVVIVGAGISGVGSACHLLRERPGSTFVVLEALESFGGTWLVHRFPGLVGTATSIRSATASSRGRARR